MTVQAPLPFWKGRGYSQLFFHCNLLFSLGEKFFRKFFQKPLTTGGKSGILSLVLFERTANHGGIAQLARALGSYPSCPRFESRCRYHSLSSDIGPFHIKRPGGQAVKTPPFHGGNTGSSPVRVTTNFSRSIWRHSSAGRASASHAEGHRFEFCCLHQNKKQLQKQLLFVLVLRVLT